MSNLIIELIAFTAVVMAVKGIQSQQQSDSVVIPVRIDENIRRR
ncbi:hypothetical protein VB715_03740 [Crocosphaera sp. UHCC 0190]|nr:hypothetical protein [Crocosphaera sp. UHCC 0190]MEA5508867.1 hypothetical protein [Crocosphaera sp. UHCC 0190]